MAYPKRPKVKKLRVFFTFGLLEWCWPGAPPSQHSPQTPKGHKQKELEESQRVLKKNPKNKKAEGFFEFWRTPKGQKSTKTKLLAFWGGVGRMAPPVPTLPSNPKRPKVKKTRGKSTYFPKNPTTINKNYAFLKFLSSKSNNACFCSTLGFLGLEGSVGQAGLGHLLCVWLRALEASLSYSLIM